MPDRRQRVLIALLLCWMLFPGLPVAAAPLEEFEKAIETIRCDCGCHPQTIADCACGRAGQMREEIAALIEGSGGSTPLTGDQVIAKYVANHGEQILIAPTATGFNLLAWIGPIIGLLLGLVLAVVVVRRLAARREPQPSVLPAGPPIEQDAVYRERLRRQLAEWD